jgi:hypothetical protein
MDMTKKYVPVNTNTVQLQLSTYSSELALRDTKHYIGIERIKRFIEGQTILRLYDLTPLPVLLSIHGDTQED